MSAENAEKPCHYKENRHFYVAQFFAHNRLILRRFLRMTKEGIERRKWGEVAEMKRVKREQLINEETGEIEFERSKIVEFTIFNEEKGYMLFLNKRNVRIFPDIPFPDDFGMKDIARLFLLSRCIVGTTNMIGKRARNGIKPMTPEDMAEIVQMPHRRFITWLNRMIRAGMIARVKIRTEDAETTQYYMNPLYFFSSRYLPLNLYLLFQEQIDRYLPAWVRQKYEEMRRHEETASSS